MCRLSRGGALGGLVIGGMMPFALRSLCSTPGCPRRSLGHGKCADHERQRRAAYDQARGSAAERGYDAAWQQRRSRYLRTHHHCAMCGQMATHVDHILPLAMGGTHDDANLQPLCASCHSRKTATIDSTFARRMSE